MSMRTFTAYRTTPPSVDHTYNEPDQPQYEGVVFSDGRVAIRWLTQFRSVSVWDSMDDLIAVHGHADEYGTEFHWNDGTVQRLGQKAA